MLRILSNLLFGAALGGCLLLPAAGASQSLMVLALACVLAAAVLTNLMWIRTVGLVALGGLSMVYTNLAGHNLAGTLLTAAVAGLVVGAVVLLIAADAVRVSNPTRRTDEL